MQWNKFNNVTPVSAFCGFVSSVIASSSLSNASCALRNMREAYVKLWYSLSAALRKAATAVRKAAVSQSWPPMFSKQPSPRPRHHGPSTRKGPRRSGRGLSRSSEKMVFM